jgi:uncharacterized protein YdhG (YjbR/CyaY superfamily)
MRQKATRIAQKTSQDAAAQIRAYLEAQPPKARQSLRQVRSAIHAAAPGAVDAFSYRMPGTRLNGKVLVWYAGFTNHFSLFPIGAAIRRTLGDEVRGYKTSTGTIQFPLAEPVPVALIKKIVKARIAEVGRRGK